MTAQARVGVSAIIVALNKAGQASEHSLKRLKESLKRQKKPVLVRVNLPFTQWSRIRVLKWQGWGTGSQEVFITDDRPVRGVRQTDLKAQLTQSKPQNTKKKSNSDRFINQCIRHSRSRQSTELEKHLTLLSINLNIL